VADYLAAGGTMANDPEPTRILVEPAGTAVILRTPLFCSARFASVDDALAWHDGQVEASLPMLAAGAAAALAKALLPDGVFLPALLVLLGSGAVGTVVMGRRRQGPTPAWLGWEESVRLDDRDPPLVRALSDLGVAAACGALLALVGFLIADGGWDDLADHGLVAEIVAVLFVAGLGVGVAFGCFSAVQRVRFALARRRGP
jgi:hypothetical protein